MAAIQIDFAGLAAQQSRIRSKLDQRMSEVLKHGHYIMGPEVPELEKQLQAFCGAPAAIAVANGTDALMIALMALDVRPGDEIITTPFSFFATVEAIRVLGAKPVFVDIDSETYLMDPKGLEKQISPRTKAIIPVSLFGQCSAMDQINTIAKKHRVPVIEDAAQSFGATQGNQFSCNLSTIATTSFFPSKPLGCYGDGGACFSQDETLAQRMRMIRVHGQEKRYQHQLIGVNSRLDSLQAAVLLAKLEIFKDEIRARQGVANRYSELLSGFKVPTLLAGNTSVWAQYTIEVENRPAVQKYLNDNGVPTAVHYPVPLHLQPALTDLGHKTGDFPKSERAAARVISLPMHAYLTEREQDYIVDVLRKAVSGER